MSPKDYGLQRFEMLLDPEIDAEIYVGDKKILQDLRLRVDRAFLAGSKMHTVILGNYGTGKTHTGQNLINYIKAKGYEADIRYITCPTPQRKNFVDLYQAVIKEFGQNMLFDLLNKIYRLIDRGNEKLGEVKTDGEKIDIINEYVANRDVSAVVLRYQAPVEDKYVIWKWVSGEKCSSQEKAFLNVIKDNSTPAEALDTLMALINIYKTVYKKQEKKRMLILMIDELEQLTPVGTVGDYVEAFRHLAEEPSIVMVLIYSVAAAQAAPIIYHEAVRTRIGYPSNYFVLDALTPQQSKDFIKELLHVLRDNAVDIKKKVADAKKDTSETVSEDFYPFTEEAVDVLLQHIQSKGEYFSPRSIETMLTEGIGNSLALGKNPKIFHSSIVLPPST